MVRGILSLSAIQTNVRGGEFYTERRRTVDELFFTHVHKEVRSLSY